MSLRKVGGKDEGISSIIQLMCSTPRSEVKADAEVEMGMSAIQLLLPRGKRERVNKISLLCCCRRKYKKMEEKGYKERKVRVIHLSHFCI